MRWTGVKHAVAGLVAVVGATGLVACDSFEPSARQDWEAPEHIYIAVDPASAEHWVISKFYETVLDNNGRFAALQLDENLGDASFRALNEGSMDLVIGCTGALLEVANPVLAAELEAEYTADIAAGEKDLNSGEWRDRTYAALLGSLPEHLATTDPSNAEGCADGNGLPQHIVPVYRKPSFIREDRNMLNWASGAITTGEFEELVESARDDGRSEEAVREFVASKGG